MHPVLFTIPIGGGYPVTSFGALLATGFLVGTWMLGRLGARFGQNPELDEQRYADLGMWILVSAILGCRLMYVVVEEFRHPGSYSSDPLRILAVWEGGLVYYGGFIAAFAVGIPAVRRWGMDWAWASDLALTAAFLGIFIGRWGCLLVGDDFGVATDVAWAITVPDPLPTGSLFPADLAGQTIHPTQIYMSLNALALFGVCRWLLPRRAFTGQVACIGWMLYAIGRSVIESFRGDEVRGHVGALSTSQFISIFIFAAGLAGYFLLSRRSTGPPVTGPPQDGSAA